MLGYLSFFFFSISCARAVASRREYFSKNITDIHLLIACPGPIILKKAPSTLWSDYYSICLNMLSQSHTSQHESIECSAWHRQDRCTRTVPECNWRNVFSRYDWNIMYPVLTSCPPPAFSTLLRSDSSVVSDEDVLDGLEVSPTSSRLLAFVCRVVVSGCCDCHRWEQRDRAVCSHPSCWLSVCVRERCFMSGSHLHIIKHTFFFYLYIP